MSEFQYQYKYPHPSVTTDCVIFGFDGSKLHVLLIERGFEPYKGRWAFPGGFLNMDETAMEGAKRELYEETGMRDAYIRQFHTFSAVNRDPRERVITVSYYALVHISEVEAGDDAAKAAWFPIDDVPDLAFDHHDMLNKAITALQRDLHFEPIAFELLPESFTMAALQSVYEAVLGVHFAPQVFCNKMLKLGIVTPLYNTNPALYKLYPDSFAKCRETLL